MFQNLIFLSDSSFLLISFSKGSCVIRDEKDFHRIETFQICFVFVFVFVFLVSFIFIFMFYFYVFISTRKFETKNFHSAPHNYSFH